MRVVEGSGRRKLGPTAVGRHVEIGAAPERSSAAHPPKDAVWTVPARPRILNAHAVLENVGHFSYIEAPQAFAAAVKAFVW